MPKVTRRDGYSEGNSKSGGMLSQNPSGTTGGKGIVAKKFAKYSNSKFSTSKFESGKK